jgi:DUF4097 and DUF4098 domain-containing protein YvlB
VRSETFSTPGPVALRIRIPAGDVEIETGDQQETAVELEVRGHDANELEELALIEVRQRGDVYEVSVEAAQDGSGLFSRRDAEYRVRIATAHGAAVRAKLASADIAGRGRYSQLDIDVASGDVQFQEVEGHAEVNTASGDIQIRYVGSAKLNSASGDIQVGGSDRRFEANTDSGDIQVGSVVAGEVKLNSASGDLEIGIAKGSRLWVDAHTVSGDTSSELDLESATVQDDEGPLVELQARSMSGDISVRRA